jgi:hypothetical protein
MPTNNFDSDALLAFVSELSKRVDDLRKELTDLGDQSGTGLKKVSNEMEKVKDTVDQTDKPLKAMKDQSGGLVSILRGSVGLGVAFYSAGKAMENFSQGEIQLRNFATDVGLTTTAVGGLRTQLAAAGIDSKSADEQLSSLASKLDSIKTYQTASPVYKAVAANDPILAKQLLDAEKIGNRMKSIDAIRERWNQPNNPRSRLYLGQELGVNQSTMEALNRNRTGLVQPWTYSQEETDKYNRDWTNAMTTVQNYWGATMMTMVGQTNQFVENTKSEFSGITSFFGGLKADFEGHGKEGSQIFGPKGFLPNKDEIGSLFGSKGILPDKKEMEDAWESLKKNMSMEAHADVPTGGETLLEGDASFSQRFGLWDKEKIETQKDSNQLLQDIRDLISGESTGPAGVAGAGYGGTGGETGPGGTSSPGGPAKLNDEAGNPIDAATMKEAEVLGNKGDVAGLQKLFAQKGYRMSGAACGIVASKYVRSAGFQPPKAGAIATSWHNWGEKLDPNDINAAEHPFGSMVGTYWHRRYGGNPNQVLAPGQTGGHVMTIVPGTYDPKTRTIDTVDQYGFKHAKRKIDDLDLRYAGKQAVEEVEARRKTPQPDQQEARDKIDSSFPGMRKDKAKVDVEFNGVPKGVKTEAELMEQGVFSTLNIKKSQQQAAAP